MSTKPWFEQTPTGSESCRPANVETMLDQAAKKARSGSYQEALRLLDRLTQDGVTPSPEELDLRAKIYAQLGYNLDAERCWLMAARADSDNPLFPLALERLRKNHRGGYSIRIVGTVLVGVAALIVLIGQGIHQTSEVRELKAQMASVIALTEQEWSDARKRQEDLSIATARGLTDVRSAFASISDTLDSRFSSVAKEAAMVARLEALDAQITQGTAAQMLQLQTLFDAAQAVTREEHAAQEKNWHALAQIGERLDELLKQFDSQVTGLAAEIETLSVELLSKRSEGAVVPVDSTPVISDSDTFPEVDTSAGD